MSKDQDKELDPQRVEALRPKKPKAKFTFKRFISHAKSLTHGTRRLTSNNRRISRLAD